MQRCLDGATESVSGSTLSWSYVHPHGASRSRAQPLNFTNILTNEQGLETCLLGEATVARRYRRQSWLSARKDYLTDMRGLESYEHYVESFGRIEVEDGACRDAFDAHPEHITEYVCLLGDFDDAIDCVNGCSVAKLTRLAQSLMCRFLSTGDQIGLVLDDDKAACPLVAMVGTTAPLPRHIGACGFWKLCCSQIPIDALDGQIRDECDPGDALRLLGVQAIEDGSGKGVRVHILAAGDCYSVLVRGAMCGTDTGGCLQIYTEAQTLMTKMHCCLVQHKSSSMSRKMMSLLATAPSENSANVWHDVWIHVNKMCVVDDGEEAHPESFCEDMSSEIAPREAFEPVVNSPQDPCLWQQTVHSAQNMLRVAALSGCHRAMSRVTSGPGGGCICFACLALALYFVLGDFIFTFQLLPVLLGVGTISTEAALHLRIGDRRSLFTGGGLVGCAGCTFTAYLYQSLLLVIVTLVMLGVTALWGRDPRGFYKQHTQSIYKNIDSIMNLRSYTFGQSGDEDDADADADADADTTSDKESPTLDTPGLKGVEEVDASTTNVQLYPSWVHRLMGSVPTMGARVYVITSTTICGVGSATSTLANGVGSATSALATGVGSATSALATGVGSATSALATGVGSATSAIATGVGSTTSALATGAKSSSSKFIGGLRKKDPVVASGDDHGKNVNVGKLRAMHLKRMAVAGRTSLVKISMSNHSQILSR